MRRSTEQEHAIMLAGFFLLCLAGFVVLVFSIHWLAGFLSSLATTGSAQSIIALGGIGATAVLARHDLGGIVIAVAVMVFWSLLLFGTESTTLTPTLTLAAAALYAAAAVALVQRLRRRRA